MVKQVIRLPSPSVSDFDNLHVLGEVIRGDEPYFPSVTSLSNPRSDHQLGEASSSERSLGWLIP